MSFEENYTYEKIYFPDDYEGEVVATLISSKKNTGNRRSVIYIHGFVDYFFHPHVGDKFYDNGYDFYALELRKYGHSLLKHQHPNYCKKVEEYFEELSFVIKKIYSLSKHKVTLLGHSTGGLLASLYLNIGEEKELVDKIILNSPFLDIYAPKILKNLIPVVANFAISNSPYSYVSGAFSALYTKSLHVDYFGEWEFNTKWKPIDGFPAYFAWINGIYKSQRFIKRNSKITVPILILHSGNSLIPIKYTKKVQSSDIVLNVNQIRKVGAKLGNDVTMETIDGAIHDVFLSQKEVRENAFEKMFKWLSNS